MKTAMILAAGRGERLRPLTNHIPKALCSLMNKPLIAHHLHHLVKAGYQKVIINHAYLGGKIRQWVTHAAIWDLEIHFSPEPPGGLETGGGIVHALPMLGSEPFITINADIFIDYDLANLHLPQGNLVHAILVNKPAYRALGDYGLSANGLLNNEDRQYIFSGITVYHPDFFQQITPGRYSVTPMIRHAAGQKRVSGELYHGVWFDIGTPAQLLMAEQALKSREVL
jgi:MurNAc alpha-1-phosphate uridylyltransferase